jgi:hypothetical protein
VYSYSSQFDPPAPVLSIDISSPVRPSPVTLPALLDSGSDITVIPRPVAKNLNLGPAYVGYALDIGGVPEGSTVFSALVSVEKEEPAIIEVLTWGEEYVLLQLV